MSTDSSESNDELIREFIEKNKELMVDPEQYPRVFMHMVRTFLYQKGLLK